MRIEKWEPCDRCCGHHWQDCTNYDGMCDLDGCGECDWWELRDDARYCPYCGRPRTAAAWAETQERIGKEKIS